jgi:hypothetical protein
MSRPLWYRKFKTYLDIKHCSTLSHSSCNARQRQDSSAGKQSGSSFLDRLFIFIWHQSVMDLLTNTDYGSNVSNCSSRFRENILSGFEPTQGLPLCYSWITILLRGIISKNYWHLRAIVWTLLKNGRLLFLESIWRVLIFGAKIFIRLGKQIMNK